MSIQRELVRSIMAIALAGALLAPLGTCGKRGDLEPPPDEEITYPRIYPRQ